MFVYLFLLAAIAASAELPTTDGQAKELQELVALCTQEENEISAALLKEILIESVPVVASSAPTIIANAIEPTMLAYKHWTGTYSPEKFSISVNGTELAEGKTVEVAANTPTVEISYDYSFMNGMRTGGKTITYKLNENSTHANITFSWKDDTRVLLDNGTLVEKVAV